MKPELIAEYRLRIKDRTLITLPVSAIERILEERERLLAALREVVGLISVDDYWNDEERHAAEAAIAYAESE